MGDGLENEGVVTSEKSAKQHSELVVCWSNGGEVRRCCGDTVQGNGRKIERVDDALTFEIDEEWVGPEKVSPKQKLGDLDNGEGTLQMMFVEF